MKILKVVLVAIVAALTFSTAEAQVSVHARIGPRPVYHQRTVVVRRGPVYRRPYYRRPVYRRPYYGRPYHRGYYHRPVYRHYYRHR